MARMIADIDFRKRCGNEGRKTALALATNTPDAYAKAWVTALGD